MHHQRFAFMLVLALPASTFTLAQSITSANPIAVTAATAIPALVRYSGTAQQANGKAQASVTFLIFKDEQAGEPLWTETQNVAFDSAGHYEVYLGATTSSGLPLDLFGSGEARWLEVQIAGEKQQPRTLLASVPYAMKAVDATTLGGLPPSAYVLAGSTSANLPASPTSVTPDATTTVTTTGGTADKLAKFSGSSTVINSIVYDNGTRIGINTINPTATLSVNGGSTLDGPVVLPSTGIATTSTGYNSESLDFSASAYNSSSKTAVSPRYVWQAEFAGNDTTGPSATLNLLSSSSTSAPTETGFHFNSNGTIHFASGQVFGADSSSGVAFNGASTSGTGVEGTSSSGSGVVGTSSATTASGAAGVTGINGNDGVGVFGKGTTLSGMGQQLNFYGAGTWGDSAVSGNDGFFPGVVGTADDQRAGLFINNSPAGYYTLQAINTTDSDTLVAYFGNNYNDSCTVDTQGDLACSGTKSAVVPVDNNTRQVALYAVEAPENWFEDFGTGQLSNGVAKVNLEPVFAQTVNLGVDYHVFLTPKGDSKGLYISKMTPTSFEVRESGGGHSTLAFDYRIVARRKGYETVRLADKTKERDPSRLPKLAHGTAAQRTGQTRQ